MTGDRPPSNVYAKGMRSSAGPRQADRPDSVNDSATAFRHAYEILWGDDDAGAADWGRWKPKRALSVLLTRLNQVIKAARDGQEALAGTLVSSWQSTEDGLDLLLARERYRRLHGLLASGRMKVRVIPRQFVATSSSSS